MFTKACLCFSPGKTSPAASSLRSTAPWCFGISGRDLGLTIRITRYRCLCRIGRISKWSGARKPQDTQRRKCRLFLGCVSLSCFSPAQAGAFSCVGGSWRGEGLRSAACDASGSSGRRGLQKLLHVSLTFQCGLKKPSPS